MSDPIRRAAIGALAIAALLILSGCAAQGPSSPGATASPGARDADAVIVLVGVTANQPRAELPVQVQPVIERAIRARAPLTVIKVDGSPTVTFHSAGYPINTRNSTAEQDDVNAEQSALLAAVGRAKATTNGSDLSAAFAIAGDQARADGSAHPAVIVVDSGLSDSGYPDLTTTGMTAADPERVAAFAAKHDEVPELPAGTTAYLTGLGYGAGPQQALTPRQREHVTGIWRALLSKAGVTTKVIPTPRTGAAPRTRFTAGVVEPAALPSFTVEQHGDAVEATLGTDVLFQPDQWDLLPSATPALGQLVTLVDSSTGTVVVQGFTDIGRTAVPGGLKALSQHRADVVRSWLIKHGTAPTRIVARGEGSGDAVTASPKNRRVTVVVHGSSDR